MHHRLLAVVVVVVVVRVVVVVVVQQLQLVLASSIYWARTCCAIRKGQPANGSPALLQSIGARVAGCPPTF